MNFLCKIADSDDGEYFVDICMRITGLGMRWIHLNTIIWGNWPLWFLATNRWHLFRSFTFWSSFSLQLTFISINSTPWQLSSFVTNLMIFTETHHRLSPGPLAASSFERQFQIFKILAPETWELKNLNLPGWRPQRRTCRCLPVWRHIRGPGSRVAARTRGPWWRPWRTSLAALWRTVCRWRCGWSWRGRPCLLSGSRWSRCSRTSVRRWSHAGSPGTAPSWANAMNERGSRRDFQLCDHFNSQVNLHFNSIFFNFLKI